MNAFVEFPDLLFSAFMGAPDAVADGVRLQLARMPLQVDHAKLDLRFAYQQSPKYPSQAGWNPSQFLFWSPSNTSGWTAMMCNSPCGRQPFIKVIANRLATRSYFVLDSQEAEFTYFDRYDPSEDPRLLAVYEEDNRWRFSAIGPVQPYEDLRNYKRKRVRDRLTRQIVSDYLATEGLDITSDSFWQSDGPAVILWEDQHGRRSKPGRDGVDEGGTRSGWKPEYDVPRASKTYIYRKVNGVFERTEVDSNFKEIEARPEGDLINEK